MYKAGFFILFVLLGIRSYGQDSALIDSLSIQLKHTDNEALKLEILDELAFNQVHPDSIIKYSNYLLIEAKDANEFSAIVFAHSYLGDAYRLKGDYDLAFKNYFTGLGMVDKHNLEIPDIFCRIADTYSVMGDEKNSTFYYKNCIDKISAEDRGLKYGRALFNLGDSYLKYEKADSADIYNKQAAKVFERESFEIGLIYTFGNKGLIEAERGNYEEAVNNLSEAISRLETYEIYDAISEYQLGMSRVLLKNKQLWLALEYGSQSLEMAHKGDYKEGIKASAQLLSKIYERLNDTGEAFNFLKMYMSYRDSTHNTSVLQRMEDIRRNYIVEKLNQIKKVKKSDTLSAPFIVDKPRYFAVLFGVNDYNFNDAKLSDLDEPIANIHSLYNSLTTKYQFDESNTLMVANPSRADIINTMEMLSEIITEKDNLLLFYAGHGVYDEKLSIGYWLPSDAKSYTKTNWLSNSVMRDYVAGIPARHILLISDACFSGSIFKTRGIMGGLDQVAVSKLYKPKSRKAMTSGALNIVPDQSVFMNYFIEGLEENESQYFSARQLFNLIEPSVLNNTHNTPQYGIMHNTGDAGGEFIFISSTKEYRQRDMD